jgi:hypothetical protein
MRTRTAALIAVPVAAVVGTVIGLATLDGEATATGNPNQVEADKRLAQAYFDCRNGTATRDGQMTLADGDRTLLLDTNPDDSKYGETFGAYTCLTEQLATPQSITSRIERTTSLQGVQEGVAAGIHYSWSYHPDHGAEVTITYEEGVL